ncbi:MAG: hypothetical protein AUG11_00845 [Nitrospirae bacterium 13_1_20CM_2_62_14]|nr:MAG: hypothetical protein AUH74_02665 [Nitrospirae bacterium 13_1_40CM_4_62_6]OLD40960.1 MAG: hypothetical protein AUI21_03080 [Nitrospirae bacterium 13_1_40CM_2_62_10]OLE42657.1 MAG: hypothetical protein AUG11_00845 [Nitrospirae bacterium 13_1_20CM_2_62_14]
MSIQNRLNGVLPLRIIFVKKTDSILRVLREMARQRLLIFCHPTLMSDGSRSVFTWEIRGKDCV